MLEPLSPAELAVYRARIGLPDGALPPDADTLTRLQTAHMAAIPFESGDVQLGLVPSLDPDTIFAKLVTRRRGGWCYEHNGLFGRALTALGYEVTRLAGAVLRETRGPVSLGTHLALLVRIDGADWLADVGFGGGLAQPLPLAPTRSTARPLPFSLDRTHDGWWRVEVVLPAGPLYYDFQPHAADEAQLLRACHWLSTSPESVFLPALVVQQRSGGEHRVLRGRNFMVSDGAGSRESLVGSADELEALLRTRFGLELPDLPAIWAQCEAAHAAREAVQALPTT